MKKITYIKTAVLSLTSMAMLSSCLKDDAHFVNFAASKPLVEIPAVTGVVGTGEYEAVAFDISTTPTPLDLQINVAAPNPLKTALTVKLSVDQTALDNYNSANGTSYALLPSADYSTSLTVTIPANQYSANLVININTSLIDPSQSYILPLTITDGGGQQISNYKTILYNVQVKNAYDDDYAATGYVFHPSAPRVIGATYHLSTAGATAVYAPVGDLGGSGYNFVFTVVPGSGTTATATNWVAEGATPAASSGFMSADEPGAAAYADASVNGTDEGQPGGAYFNSTIYNNTYDGTNKIFWLHYGYSPAAGGPTGQTGYTRQFYEELVAQ